MISNKINQNTAIINYQNTYFYVHCWRLPKEVKQKKFMLLCHGGHSAFWKTQRRQDTLLL